MWIEEIRTEIKDLKQQQIYLKETLSKLAEELSFEVEKNQLFRRNLMAYHRMFDDFLIELFGTQTFNNVNVRQVLLEAQKPMVEFSSKDRLRNISWMPIVFRGRLLTFPLREGRLDTDLILMTLGKGSYPRSRLIVHAIQNNIPMLAYEDGFIESILPWRSQATDSEKLNPLYYKLHSFIVDNIGLYYSAQRPSTLENMLNSDYALSEAELLRARKLMETIRKERISKYNHQPIMKEMIGQANKKKILVVDQVFGDASIHNGMATDDTFGEMLATAIAENPYADILVKTHPVSKSLISGGHYADISSNGNVYVIDYPANPISLLEYVDSVYVCTSTMGMEALLCGKEVHTFGMPFYAGWGLTHDRHSCPRRRKKRSIEEIFYMAYVLYSIYVSYKSNSICEIEQAMDEILELREEYWRSHKS